MTHSSESGSGGLLGESNQGRQAPTAETLAALDALLERCGKPDLIQDERRADIIVAPAAPEAVAARPGAEGHYMQVLATLRAAKRPLAGSKPLYAELVVTETVPRFDEASGILSDPDLYRMLRALYRGDPVTTDDTKLAGYIIGQAGPNIEHNEVTQKDTYFADGTALSLYQCRPVSGPITWAPETAEMLHVEYRQADGRSAIYIKKSDGAQELFVTQRGAGAIEIKDEDVRAGLYRATEAGVRELAAAIAASLASSPTRDS